MDVGGKTAHQLAAKRVLMAVAPQHEDRIRAFILSLPWGSCVATCEEIARKASQSTNPAESLVQAIGEPPSGPGLDMDRIFAIIQADRPSWREGKYTKALWEREFRNVRPEELERAVYHYLRTSNLRPSLHVVNKALKELAEGPPEERNRERASRDIIVQRYMKRLPKVERNGVWYDAPWSPEIEKEALALEERGETRDGRPVLDGGGDWGYV